MDSREFNKILDQYLCEGTMGVEDYLKMDEYQQYTIQQIKKAYKRFDYNDKNI